MPNSVTGGRNDRTNDTLRDKEMLKAYVWIGGGFVGSRSAILFAFEQAFVHPVRLEGPYGHDAAQGCPQKSLRGMRTYQGLFAWQSP